jgi:hypothetical protein
MNIAGRIILVLLCLSSLCGYLEWGTGQSAFVFEAEATVVSKLFVDPLSVVHPFTIVPLLGQLLLLVAIILPKPSKRMIEVGIISIGVLYLFLLVIGVVGMKLKIVLSVLPFLLLSILWFKKYNN